MTWLRVGARLTLIALLTLVASLLLLVGRVLTLPWPRAWVRWRTLVFRGWSRRLLAVLGVQLETVGRAPDLPFFLVSNHLGYLDIPVLASHTGMVFIAKSEIAGWPVVGRVCKSVDTIFIDREARRDIPRVIARIDRQLGLGAAVALFPEGTSSEGATVLPFRPSLLEVPARGHMPVSVASLSYHIPGGETPAHLGVCWWGGMAFGPHLLNLLSIPRIRARVVFGDQQISDSDRKRLAARLRETLLAIFEPTVQESP